MKKQLTELQRLLRTLNSRGLSQHEIARRSGCPQPIISRIACGRQTDVWYSHGKALERLVEDTADLPSVPVAERTGWGNV